MKTRIGILAITAAMATGCITSPDSQKTQNASSASTQENSPKWKYRAALAMWKSNEVSYYNFNLNMDCFCEIGGWMEVSVRAGKVVAVDSIPGTYGHWDDCALQNVPRVDDLFELVASYLDHPDYDVEAEYHYGLGYPTKVAILRKEPLPDADIHFQAVDLKWWD